MSHRRKPPLAPLALILFAALTSVVMLLLPVCATTQSVLNILGGLAGLV